MALEAQFVGLHHARYFLLCQFVFLVGSLRCNRDASDVPVAAWLGHISGYLCDIEVEIGDKRHFHWVAKLIDLPLKLEGAGFGKVRLVVKRTLSYHLPAL